jgi:ABC-type dipeptide/oligopeptide/nickel transport system permease subunit
MVTGVSKPNLARNSRRYGGGDWRTVFILCVPQLKAVLSARMAFSTGASIFHLIVFGFLGISSKVSLP